MNIYLQIFIYSWLCGLTASEVPPNIMLEATPNPFTIVEKSITKTELEWNVTIKNNENFYDGSHPGAEQYKSSNPIIEEVDVMFRSIDQNIIRVRMTDHNAERWEVPNFYGSPPDLSPKNLSEMGLEISPDSPFGFSITDQSKQKVFDTADAGTIKTSLKYFDKYLEFGVRIPSERIFGIGEHSSPFQMANGSTSYYTLWNLDSPNPYTEGESGSHNEYGSHPFFTFQLPNKEIAGIYLRNSNAMNYVLVKNGDGSCNVYHKTIGGVLDLYFIYSGTMDTVLKKYHALIGYPYLPPFWALGWQQSRYGWHTLSDVQDVVSKYNQLKLPLDVVWSDIDYMHQYADFTVSPSRYGGLKAFVDNLHTQGIRYVPIIDAGIKYESKYYNIGEKAGCFIKSASTQKTLIGKVWPGYAAFPDFFHPQGKPLWHAGLGDLHSQVAFDGIWIDMNEISNFCWGECPPEEMGGDTHSPDGDTHSPDGDTHSPDEFNNLPYVPGGNLNMKTVSITGYQYGSTEYEDKFHKQYYTHNLWSLQEASATHTYFEEVLKQRPFVLSRSSSPGTGRFSSVWLGDTFSKWEYMRYSIAGVFDMQIFGIPLTGADICGFIEAATAELCGRWTQLGAFYPFSRNHNIIGQPDQYPWSFGSQVLTGQGVAIRQKYSILRYYYTVLFGVSMHGGSVISPLFFHYPHDERAFQTTPYQLVIGGYLMVSPVLYPNAHYTLPYLPNGNWWDFRTLHQVLSYNDGNNGTQLNIPCELSDPVVLHIRGGGIIPYQNASHNTTIMRTAHLDQAPLTLIIALDHFGTSSGYLVVDDGLGVHTIPDGLYRRYYFHYAHSILSVALTHTGISTHYQYEKFYKIIILGGKAEVNGCVYLVNGGTLGVAPQYEVSTHLLSISNAFGYYWDQIKSINVGEKCLLTK